MQIRRATIEDAEGVAETVISAWRSAYRGVLPDEFIDRREVEPTARRIRESWNPARLALVVVDEDGRVVAQATEHRPPQRPGFQAEIGALYVRAGCGRQGHGSRLLRAMAEEFLADGRRSLCIHTLRENRIGRAFYERAGGVLIGEDEWSGYPAVWYGWEDVSVIGMR